MVLTLLVGGLIVLQMPGLALGMTEARVASRLWIQKIRLWGRQHHNWIHAVMQAAILLLAKAEVFLERAHVQAQPLVLMVTWRL